METFDMHGEESINSDGHGHNIGDPCHRCDSKNTTIESDCISGFMYWVYLKCRDCKLCCIYDGGSEY